MKARFCYLSLSKGFKTSSCLLSQISDHDLPYVSDTKCENFEHVMEVKFTSVVSVILCSNLYDMFVVDFSRGMQTWRANWLFKTVLYFFSIKSPFLGKNTSKKINYWIFVVSFNTVCFCCFQTEYSIREYRSVWQLSAVLHTDVARHHPVSKIHAETTANVPWLDVWSKREDLNPNQTLAGQYSLWRWIFLCGLMGFMQKF